MNQNAIPGVGIQGASAPTGASAFNPVNNQTIDYGRSDLATIASKNNLAGINALGGFNPVNTASQASAGGFTSSAQPIINQQSAQGISGATNNLMNGGMPQGSQPQYPPQYPQSGVSAQGQGTTPQTPLGSTLQTMQGNTLAGYQSGLGAINSNYQIQLQNAQLSNQQLGLSYNTALGGLNQQYNQAFQQLQTQHMNTIGAAVSQMSQADPMGLQNSSFSSGYVGKVNDMYSQQASFLTSAYNQQQVALQNGQASAALNIQQQINQAQANFSQQIASLNQGLANSMSGIAQFGQQQQTTTTSQFTQLLNSTQLTGVNAQATTGELQQQFPNLFQLGQQAGFQPDQIAQSIRTGTQAQASLLQRRSDLALKWQTATAQYGNAINPGGGTSGSGATSPATGLSDWGSKLITGGGGAALTSSGGQSVTKALTGMISSASPDNLNTLIGFVNSGNSNVFTSSVGGLLNSFFGANIGDITSSKDVASAASEFLGINPTILSNLSNQSVGTRAQVVNAVLGGLKSKIESESGVNSKLYNLKPIAPDLDSAHSNIVNALSSIGQSLTSNGYQTSVGGGANLNSMSWSPQDVWSNFTSGFSNSGK